MPQRRPPFRGPESFKNNLPREKRESLKQKAPEVKREAETAWKGEAARWYDNVAGERGSEYQQEVVFPGALRLLDARPGLRVLDLACGQGAFSRVLAKQGVRVTGVDASEDLIARARQHSPQEIRYVVSDVQRLDAPPDVRFDAVACILSIQNIDPIESVFSEVAKVLLPKGRFVIVMNHPAFRAPRQSGWVWDEQRKLQYRRVDSYLSLNKIPIQVHPGAQPGLITWSFHRPLKTYVTALANAGFAVDALEEWPSHRSSQPGPKAKGEDRARDEIPLFLALRARPLA